MLKELKSKFEKKTKSKIDFGAVKIVLNRFILQFVLLTSYAGSASCTYDTSGNVLFVTDSTARSRGPMMRLAKCFNGRSIVDDLRKLFPEQCRKIFCFMYLFCFWLLRFPVYWQCI